MDVLDRYQQFITLNIKEKYFGQFRWKLGIGTNPCIRTRKNNRCIYCGFVDLENPIQPKLVHEVFNKMLKNNPSNNIRRLELYLSGSFFDNVEITQKSRAEVVDAFSNSDIGELVVESRPEFINEKYLYDLTKIIDPGRLTIAIGIETMDETARNNLSKDISNFDILNAINSIARAGMNFQAYLLLKQPNMVSDRDAVLDIVRSVNKLITITKHLNLPLIIAIQPLFVAKDTEIFHLYNKKKCLPPWLYTIALVMRILDEIRKNSGLEVILGNSDDNINKIALPSNYTQEGAICQCTNKFRYLLKKVNNSYDESMLIFNEILNSPCKCKKIWEKEMKGLNLIEDNYFRNLL